MGTQSTKLKNIKKRFEIGFAETTIATKVNYTKIFWSTYMPKYLCIQVYLIAGTSIGYQKEGVRTKGCIRMGL